MAKKIAAGCGAMLLLFVVLLFLVRQTLLKTPPKAVKVETVSRGDVSVQVVETGTVEPLSKVDVKSRVGGRIASLLVDEGDVVKQGQIIATIDPQQINSQVAALQSQLTGSEARMAAAQKTASYQKLQTSANIRQYVQAVAAAKARLQSAETQAEVQPAITRQSIAIAKANLEAAQGTLSAQKDALHLLVTTTDPNAVASAKSTAEQAAAQAANTTRNLQREKLLLTQGFASQQAVDAANADARVTVALEQEAREKLSRIEQANKIQEENASAQVAAAQGTVNQAQAALLQAESDTLPRTKLDDLLSARAAYSQALAQLTAAESGHVQDLEMRDQAMAAAADVDQARHNLDNQLVSQGDTILRSPMDGVISRRYVEKGDLITSGIDSFSSGTPVMQVADLNKMLVQVNINEVDVDKLRRGMPADVTIDAWRGALYKGYISKISPSALSDNSASSSSSSSSSGASAQTVIKFQVQITILHADRRLRPGMSAHCTIWVAQTRNVLRAPVDCVSGTGHNGTVNVVTTAMQNGRAVQAVSPRTVSIGLRGDNYVEVLSGLQPGDKLKPLPYSGPPRATIDMQAGNG